MIPEITHILYDLGNTLLYFDGDWDVVFRQAVTETCRLGERFDLDAAGQAALAGRLAVRLEQNNARRTADLVEQEASSVFSSALSDLGVSPADKGELDRMVAAFYSVTQAHWIPVPGARRALAGLRDRGYSQAVLSNAASDADVQALVDKADLRPHLDFVLTSARVGRRKPHPEMFQRVEQIWDVKPEMVLMIGDRLDADIQGGGQAGMATVWVRKYAAETAGDIQPDAVIDTVANLPDLLPESVLGKR